ncbi:hypothetical protein COO60DRAFT_449132 [Scenedesmus sp. NREL 46B-D3]|nr:hypothetical protein COO60DRAFT_449132 [Scenedesmus sp. NREL 46B-D3]
MTPSGPALNSTRTLLTQVTTLCLFAPSQVAEHYLSCTAQQDGRPVQPVDSLYCLSRSVALACIWPQGRPCATCAVSSSHRTRCTCSSCQIFHLSHCCT